MLVLKEMELRYKKSRFNFQGLKKNNFSSKINERLKMKKSFLKSKRLNLRSQSEVISTMLLVLLVIASAAVIIGFVVPFVKEQLSKGDCFEYSGKVDITNNLKFTCYKSDPDPTKTFLNLEVHLGEIDEESKNPITGFKIILTGSASKSFDITSGATIPDVYLFPGPFAVPPGASTLEIPVKRGSGVTYTIANVNPKPDSVIIYPILKNGRMCSEESYTLNSIPNCAP